MYNTPYYFYLYPKMNNKDSQINKIDPKTIDDVMTHCEEEDANDVGDLIADFIRGATEEAEEVENATPSIVQEEIEEIEEPKNIVDSDVMLELLSQPVAERTPTLSPVAERTPTLSPVAKRTPTLSPIGTPKTSQNQEPMKTTIDGIPAEITISNEKAPPAPSEEEIMKLKDKYVEEIKVKAEEIEKTSEYLHKYDFSHYIDNKKYLNYIQGILTIPSTYTNIKLLSLKYYINETTIFDNYNPFDSVNKMMLHDLPTRVVIVSKFNKLVNEDVIDLSSKNFRFDNYDQRICGFINKHKDVGTTKFEYSFIKSCLNKLIISLNTDCEMAFKTNDILVKSTFKSAVIRDLKMMSVLQIGDSGKTQMSWNKFVEALTSHGAESHIYKHDNYQQLNKRLTTAYATDFLSEIFIGNALKTYTPTIHANYFYTIKSIYMTARLISIYLQKFDTNGHPSKTVEHLKIIAAMGTISYENKSDIFKNMPRTMPYYEKDISEEAQMYYFNHILKGGQYMILKMIEESIPSITTLKVRS